LNYTGGVAEDAFHFFGALFEEELFEALDGCDLVDGIGGLVWCIGLDGSGITYNSD